MDNNINLLHIPIEIITSILHTLDINSIISFCKCDIENKNRFMNDDNFWKEVYINLLSSLDETLIGDKTNVIETNKVINEVSNSIERYNKYNNSKCNSWYEIVNDTICMINILKKESNDIKYDNNKTLYGMEYSIRRESGHLPHIYKIYNMLGKCIEYGKCYLMECNLNLLYYFSKRYRIYLVKEHCNLIELTLKSISLKIMRYDNYCMFMRFVYINKQIFNSQLYMCNKMIDFYVETYEISEDLKYRLSKK
ncbi:F-box domain-containing protein [Orpheovirus IHUMI-LCC2]|uniref:F-box domain-containing protein n=1 Tax=Orpheovirus IHUMI-LCC2 TaxID=2023057 RepID=A0A2I2L3J8_9VIRU|nr:F-box domain-containing protein [Orpheovirus IHUMI-LCC2]SNW62118.1 F-box domain-containing protein [Orpheovirus IHUMI-LCC2]